MRAEPYSWSDLRRLVDPRTVAIVGASPTPGSFGDNVLKNCAGFDGEILLVNPGYERIGERPCHRSLAELPTTPDHVIVAVKRELVLPVLEECGARGVGGVTVFASGYGELGEAGRAEQDALAEAARRGGFRLAGPNTVGSSNFVSGALLTFSPEIPQARARPNAVGLVSQSGAVGYAAAQAVRRGVNVSHMLICGNSADVDVADYVAYLAADPACAVIVCMLEGLGAPRRLVLAARAAREAGKPLVMFKAARGERGAAAAVSHTGAMAGAHDLYVAALEAEGAIFVSDHEALLDTASFLAKAGPPRGGDVAILTASGGWGIILADEAEAAGVSLPPLPDAARQAIEAIIPAFGSAANPCDVTAQILSNRRSLALCANALLEGETYDLLIWPQPYVTTAGERDYAEMVGAVGDIARAQGKLACMVWSTQWLETPASEAGERHTHVAVFRSARHCFAAVAAWIRRAERLAMRDSAAVVSPAARARVADLLVHEGPTLSERLAKQVFAEYGVTVVAERRAADPDEAARMAAEVGFPVVVKVDAPDLAHKSDLGGVRLDLRTADAVRLEARAALEAVARGAPQARIDGLLVQAMVPRGVELLVGGRVDPQFGPFVAVGFGGVLAEAVRDVALRPAPVGPDAALAMINDLTCRPILDGVRGAPPVDMRVLGDTVARISTLIADHAQRIAELDINPLICLSNGAVVADALIVLSAPQRRA
jgi:acetyl-CoA synthetase